MLRKIAKNLFFLTPFLLPTYLIRMSFFGISLNVLDILEGMTFLLCFPLLFWERKKIFPLLREQKQILFAFFCIFLGTVSSAYFSEGISPHEWGILKSWIVLPFLFVFFGQLLGWLRFGFWAYAFSAGAVSFFSLVFPFNTGITYDGRLRGWYESPNQLAMYIAPAIVFLYFSFRSFWRKGKKDRAGIVLAMLFLSGFALFETRSFGGILSVVAGISFGEILFLLRKGKKFSKKRFFAVCGIACAIFIFLLPMIGEKMGERSSFASRVMIWKSALRIGQEHPIFGIGPGNFQENYLKYQRFFPPYLEWAVPHPHNVVLAFWLYSGTLGLFGFFYTLFFMGKALWKNKKTATIFQITVFSVFFSLLMFGFSDTIFWGNAISAVFLGFTFSATCGGRV